MGDNDDGEELYGKKQVFVVDASAPIKTVKKMAITDILSRVPNMPIERQKPKKVGGVVRCNATILLPIASHIIGRSTSTISLANS